MTTKTAYKVLDNKGVEYLQYLKSYRFLLFFKLYKWEFIVYPNIKGKPHYVNNQIPEFKNLRKFIIKYPDIDDYFKTEYLERKAKYGAVKH